MNVLLLGASGGWSVWRGNAATTLGDGLPGGAVQVVDRYGLRSRISRGDVAAYMLDAMERQGAFTMRTPMISRK